MKAWGKLPQEMAMGIMLHDHANAMSNIRHATEAILDELCKPDGQQDLARMRNMALAASNGVKREKKVIDDYYLKFQADFPEST